MISGSFSNNAGEQEVLHKSVAFTVLMLLKAKGIHNNTEYIFFTSAFYLICYTDNRAGQYDKIYHYHIIKCLLLETFFGNMLLFFYF